VANQGQPKKRVDDANNRYGVFTRSSKRPANFQQMYLKHVLMLDVCWIM